jgi:hypothetical protein
VRLSLFREKSWCDLRAELAKLRRKRLPEGTDAGVAEATVLRVYFGRILWKA